MTLQPFHVAAWAGWAPGRQSPEDWRVWAGGGALAEVAGAPTSDPVPLLLRRRISAIGQQALRAAWGLPAAAEARLIFASRHGEFTRTLSILDALVGGEPVSPADFTLSVHHALAGLLSIARRNRLGYTAIAAGRDSFGYAMLEALACLSENPAEPVLLVYYDEPLPAPYCEFDRQGEHLALAMTFAARGDGSPLSLTLSPRQGEEAPSVCPGQDFLRFLLRGEPHACATGERHIWHWGRA